MKEKLKAITFEDVDRYVYWLAAYFPVIALLIYKFLKDNYFPKGICIKIADTLKVDFTNDFFIFIILFIVTNIIYRTCNNKYLSKVKNKKNNNILELSVKKFETISLNDYSFFILSLLLPFISQNSTDILELLVNLAMIFTIIKVLVKKNQMIINPIFLFSKNNIFKAVVEIDGNNKDVFVITKEEQLGSNDNFNYSKYFGIYYIEKKKNEK